MTRLIPIFAFALLAACQTTVLDDQGRPMLADISEEALAALPPGIPPSVLIRDGEGCYGIVIEEAEPRRGFALLDANRQPICDA